MTEAVEAISNDDPRHIAEELGDLGFLVMFCLELLAERHGIGVAEALVLGELVEEFSVYCPRAILRREVEALAALGFVLARIVKAGVDTDTTPSTKG